MDNQQDSCAWEMFVGLNLGTFFCSCYWITAEIKGMIWGAVLYFNPYPANVENNNASKW